MKVIAAVALLVFFVDLNYGQVTISTTSTEPEENNEVFSTSSEENFRDFSTAEKDNGRAACDPGTVTNLIVSPSDFNATVSWEAPSDNCVDEYVVYLDDDEYNRTSETSVLLSNLIACQDYKVGVEIASSTGTGEKTEEPFKTNLPTNFNSYGVNNLTITKVDDDKLNISWYPPDAAVEKCVTSYYLIIWDQDNKIKFSEEIIDPFHVEDSIIGCMEYNIQVSPLATAASPGGLSKENYTAEGYVMSPPGLQKNKEDKYTINITVSIDSYKKNMCEVKQVLLRCEADATNADFDWVIQNGQQILQISDSSSRQERYPMVVEDLSPFTNYSCFAIVTNSIGDSPESSLRLSIRTKEDTLSPPTDLKVTDRTWNSFNISWSDPENVTGIMEHFGISIVNLGPVHYVQERCLDITNSTDTIPSNNYEYFYEFALPNFNYNVEVFGIDGAGDGEPNAIKVTTLRSFPGIPEEFKLLKAIISNETSDYNVTQPISWQSPCNANGPLEMFVLSLEGRYSEDGQLIDEADSDLRQFNVSKNNNESDIVYNFDILEIKPSYFYNISLKAVNEKENDADDDLESDEIFLSFISPDGFPGAPVLSVSNETDSSFLATWQEPSEKYGKIINYVLTISSLGPLSAAPGDCPIDDKTYVYNNLSTENQFSFSEAKPYYNYSCQIKAETSAGLGPSSNEVAVVTQQTAPETVRNSALSDEYSNDETYKGSLTVSFQPPCNLNGPFITYTLEYSGTRNNQEYTESVNSSTTEISIDLKPDYDYSLKIFVATEKFLSEPLTESFHSKSGVPVFGSESLDPPKVNDTTKAYFDFSKTNFDDVNGDVLYYSLMIMSKSENYNGSAFGFWDGVNWPRFQSANATQITQNFWNPFENGGETTSFVIGGEKCNNSDVCNGALKQNTEYSLIVRAFTSAGYKDSPRLDFKTKEMTDDIQLGLVLGLVFGILACLLLIVFIFFLRRRRKKSELKAEEEFSESTPQHVDSKKFLAYYTYIEENPHVVKSQFTLLGTKSKEVALPTTFALLPENKRKNRYSNVLPYDQTRVKLLIEEDDEISSDYINASYIKGYSGESEYIATQGPLESTCRDFWKMVVQENVTIIVMVTQFVEQSKEKCYQYFPKNHEKLSFGDYEVRCAAELHFGTYCVRTLQVLKEPIQKTVIHMQFLDWPDFGVPTGTANILQFCCQMRERVKTEGGLIAVHCSAGVGRTGTIIATDILLQTIEDHRDINVFEAVLDLRKQRINMVQTEKQYTFIYTCIQDALQRPATPITVNEKEPMYENMSVLRSSLEDNLIGPEIESAL